MSKTACLNLPGVNSSAAQWKNWHIALKGCVGKNNANQLFTMQYDKVGYDSTTELRKYMESQGVQLDRDVADRLTDTGMGAYNFIGGMFEFSSGVAMIVVVMILGGAGVLLYNMAKDPDTAVRVGTAVATKGKSEMITGGGGMKKIGK
jgi:hypothetical protein